jgi:hypothetical protein
MRLGDLTGETSAFSTPRLEVAEAVNGEVETISQSTDPILSDPREALLVLVLAQDSIETIIRNAWWPRP